jgi:hypothetical protein
MFQNPRICPLDGLQTAAEHGRFFAAISGFIVAGRKP